MKCPYCQSKKVMKSKVVSQFFTESGLDHILLCGVKLFECDECSEHIYDYGNVHQLNRLIVEILLKKKELLSGSEIRFLRTYAGYSSQIFARIIGLDKTSYSRIENNRAKISNQVNMAVRFIIAGKISDRNYDIHDLILALEQNHLIDTKKTKIKVNSKGHWHLLAA